jgi:AraC family transcriptional regulator
MTGKSKTGLAMIERQRLRALDPSLRIIGAQEGWAAPVALINAVDGFGEAHWVEHSPETLISYQLSGGPVFCEWGRRKGASSGDPQTSIALTPRGGAHKYMAYASVKCCQIYLPDDLIDRVAEGLGHSAKISGKLRDDLVFHEEPGLAALIRSYVERTCLDDEPASRVESDARAMLIVERLLSRLHDLTPSGRQPERGGLAPWQVRRTTEYLHDNLARDVALGELAGVAKLSPFHFARAFKASMGRPPHAYLRDLRIARAKAMLVETDLPLTEIAALVGYEAPQTLGKAFRRETGVTPSDYRRERRA